jgi:glyoxylase-like metal-dependent hydrolase (beta-lactamase superfamily II)
MDMAFSTEPEPARLTPIPVREGLHRIVAENPGPLTYHGTNTWLLDTSDGRFVIDPGPDLPAHIEAVAACGPVARILLTHTHPDHAAGAASLKAATGAPIHGWGMPWAKDFRPDVAVAHGERIGKLTALHTPGHASDHLAFALDNGTVFTGDHVMSWSTTIVSPPDGDMADYMSSLRLLLSRQDRLYLPGHGPPLENPLPLVRALRMHRSTREAAIGRALNDTPRSEAEIVGLLYAGLPAGLARAAERTVLAHLLKLLAEGRAGRAGEGWVRAGSLGAC